MSSATVVISALRFYFNTFNCLLYPCVIRKYHKYDHYTTLIDRILNNIQMFKIPLYSFIPLNITNLINENAFGWGNFLSEKDSPTNSV